jgi:hypothetical protein
MFRFSRGAGFPLGIQWCFGGEGTGGAGGAEPPARTTASDVLNRYSGDAIRMAERVSQLENDNFKLREKNRDANAENATLKTKLPGEGAVILTAEQAQAWEAYQKLGKPEDVTRDLDAGRAAITKSADYERRELLDTAAKDLNFKPGLLKTLMEGKTVERREVEVRQQDGTTKKEPQYFLVSEAGGQKTEKPLHDYFKEQGDDVLQSLDAGEGGTSNVSTHAGGTPYPAQGAGQGKVGYEPKNRYQHNIKKAE